MSPDMDIDVLLVLLSVFAALSLSFVLTHLRPLKEHELQQLGAKRRGQQIRAYFSFATAECNVDKEVKKRMNPNGKLYRISEGLFEFPSIAAALLKYKKHEWIIISFEKHKKIDLIWLNKGFDRSGVSPYLPVEEIANIAKPEHYTSILIFHNHPNSDPSLYDCSKPSSEDVESANKFAHVLNTNGINLIEFVCERGLHYEYFSSLADSFFPLSEYVVAIGRINGVSRLKNFSLHIERMF